MPSRAQTYILRMGFWKMGGRHKGGHDEICLIPTSPKLL
jgi:hypothetical protein